MDKILECANNYKKLTDIRYLLGLHKLTDLVGIASGNRKKIFNQVLGKSITQEQIEKSSFFDKLESRIEPLYNLEKLLKFNT